MRIILLLILCSCISSAIYAQNFGQAQAIPSASKEAGDRFGRSVTIHKNTALIGAYADDKDTANNPLYQVGSAYFYEFNTGNYTWNEVQKVIPNDSEASSAFGISVSLTDSFALIGAPGNRTDAHGNQIKTQAGAAYIFKKNIQNQWVQEQKLVPSDRKAHDRFGFAVSLWKHTAIIATHSKDLDTIGGSISKVGVVYVFKRNAQGQWVEKQKILAPDPHENLFFGFSLALQNNDLLIGAPGNSIIDSIPNYTGAGAVYAYTKDSISKQWVLKQKLNTPEHLQKYYFGHSLSIDSSQFIVSAMGSYFNHGTAYVYNKNNGLWSMHQQLEGDFLKASFNLNLIGNTVAISGNKAIAGTPNYTIDTSSTSVPSLVNCGIAYAYTKDNNNIWHKSQDLYANKLQQGATFGFASALYNGNAIITACNEDSIYPTTDIDMGAAYAFNIWGSIGLSKYNTSPMGLFPNPAQNTLNVQLPSQKNIESYRIYNTLGAVEKEATQTKTTKIDISKFIRGIYYIEVKDNKGDVYITPFLKR